MAAERRVRVGVLGAGLIAQVEHIPNLLGLADRFELVAFADPSAAVREAVSARYAVPGVPDLDALVARGLDALVVAVPDPLHAAAVLAGLDAGLHVLCEKPLCLTEGDANAIADRRDATGRIVQVGYMKRYDPNYEAALEALPDGGDGLRYISVEVSDPDAWPFVAHRPLVRPDDLPPELVEDVRRRQRAQAAEALGVEVDGDLLRGFAEPLMSGGVHVVNAVHGMLDRMGLQAGPVVAGQVWAGGTGGAGTVQLLDGRALWHLAQVLVPDVAWYRERYTLHFDDLVVELQFPSPYLNHQQTDLWVRRSRGLRLDTVHVRAGHDEAFVRELEAFWASVVDGAPVRTPVEDAIRDNRLLTAIARCAAGAAEAPA
jgi:predicted dehydrogenase